MITGATGSGTEALAMAPRAGGGGKHTRAFGGIWSGSVVSTPGTGSAGSDRVGAAELVDDALALGRMAVPPVLLSQPATTPADRQSRPATTSVA